MKPLAITCSTSTNGLYNVFVIDKAFEADYYHMDLMAAKAGKFDQSRVIKIAFLQSRNPLSAVDIKGLKISTYMSQGQLVDSFDSGSAVLFIVNPAPFYKASVVAE